MIHFRLPSAPDASRHDAPTVAPHPLRMVSVVICTLDEHEAIGGVIDDVVADLAGVPHEIIVVDDSVDDATAQVVLGRARSHGAVRLIRREGAGGLASAAIAGWDAARGDRLAIMDGDGQHDPRLVRRMLARMDRTPVDVVVASRYLDAKASGLTGYRHWISRAGVTISGLLLGLRLADPMSGCFVMTRDWYQSVRPRLSGLGFKILIDVVASDRRRPALLQIPTALRPRAGGVSKLDLRVAFDLVALLIEKRTGGALPARMTQFLFVGLTGLLAHLTVLGVARALGAPFWLGQSGAILMAMSWNFMLNNGLTFRDRRLHGRALWQGLLSFYVACLGGAVVSEAVGAGLHALEVPWLAAGAAGALLGAFWNYRAVQRLTWRPAKAARKAARSWPPWRGGRCVERGPVRTPVRVRPARALDDGGCDPAAGRLRDPRRSVRQSTHPCRRELLPAGR
jgi:dolichol-phosphate mannosyltransferase